MASPPNLHLVIPAPISDGDMTASTIPETDYTAWAAATAYAVGDTRIYTLGGLHWVIQCIQAHTSAAGGANDPAVDINRTSGTGSFWLRFSFTNRWKLADGKISDQSALAGTIVVDFIAEANATGIALFNLQCNTCQVEIFRPDTTRRHNRVQSAIETGGIIDWWTYFFAPIEYKTEMMFQGVPIFAGDTVRVTLSGLPTNKIGEVVWGVDYELGQAIFPLSVGIIDYSTKDRDIFGTAYITPRAFASRAEYKAVVPTANVNRVKRILASVSATPVVIYTNPGDNRTGAMVYGIIKSFDIDEVSANVSYLSLQIEGLI